MQSSPRAVRDAPGAHRPPVAAVARHPRAAVPGETVVAACLTHGCYPPPAVRPRQPPPAARCPDRQTSIPQSRRRLSAICRSSSAVRRLQHPRRNPPEPAAQFQRLLQIRQQRRRVRAVPAPTGRRRSPCRGRIRHLRLVPQQVFVQVPEAAAAHAPTSHRPLHRPRQRVVPARVQGSRLRCCCCSPPSAPPGGELIAETAQAAATGSPNRRRVLPAEPPCSSFALPVRP